MTQDERGPVGLADEPPPLAAAIAAPVRRDHDWFSDDPGAPERARVADPAHGAAAGRDAARPGPSALAEAPARAEAPAPEPALAEGTAAAARLPFFPGLEGLRGVAVVAVVVFHGGFAMAKGGFLGVSTFFTLSGFLITSLLLAEHTRTGSVDLRSFWGHRFRRLLPAALATVALVVVFGAVAADPLQRQRLAGDLVGSIGYVANWRFVLSGQSYADLFGAPSPLLHFWSLAIEEQFYLLYPLLAYGVLKVLRWSRRAFAAVLAVMLAASLGLSLFAGFSIDRIYYGTDTRAAELLVGALVAVALTGPRLRAFAAGTVRHAAALGIAATVALGIMVLTWMTTEHSSAWLYHGGFVLYAGLSALVLAGALLPSGPLAVVLGTRPLRFMGKISYGVYLYHWPIFAWLNEQNTGFQGVALFGYQLVVTMGIATLSYRYLEMPIREGRPLLPGRTIPLGRAALGAAGLIAALGLLVSATAPPLVNDFAAAQKQLEARNAAASVSPTAVPDPDAGPGRPAVATSLVPSTLPAVAGTAAPPVRPPLPAVPRTAIFGDSTMLTTGLGLGDVLTETGAAAPVGGHTQLGCGLGRGGERQSAGKTESVPEPCDAWPDEWAQAIDQVRPDIAIVQEGPWDAAQRKLPGDDTWRAPGDPVYDAYLKGEIERAVTVLGRQGARIVWLTSPPVSENVRTSGQPELDQLEHPERIARVNELVREVAAAHPDSMRVVDLAAWLQASNDDARLRPDGVHLGDAESREVAQRWLAAEVIRAARGA
jgi:peptidoglycan/LPS O-acetylase OafA/YrhL